MKMRVVDNIWLTTAKIQDSIVWKQKKHGSKIMKFVKRILN